MSPTPSDKTELKPCPFCGYSSLEIVLHDSGIGFLVKCWHCYSTSGNSQDQSSAIKAWNRRSEPSKSTSETMSKEDPLKSPNPLPSSPTDKCREEFEKVERENEFLYPRKFWNAAWQASRKECEEKVENWILDTKSRSSNLQVENGQLKEKLRLKEEFRRKEQSELMKENVRLKQELQQAIDRNLEWLKGWNLLDDQIASFQSVVEAKEKALGRLWNACCGTPIDKTEQFKEARAALHIDQSGGKKEEPSLVKAAREMMELNGEAFRKAEELLTGSATPVSSHVGTKEPTAEECLEWLGYRTGYSVRVYDLTVVVMIEKLGLPVIAGEGLTPLEAIRKAMRKSSGNDGSTDDQLKSKERKEI